MKNLVFPVGRLILDLQKKTVSQQFFFFWKPQLVSLVGSIEEECGGMGSKNPLSGSAGATQEPLLDRKWLFCD